MHSCTPITELEQQDNVSVTTVSEPLQDLKVFMAVSELLCVWCHKTVAKLIADDTTLYKPCDNTNNCNQIGSAIESASKGSSENSMRLNADKT